VAGVATHGHYDHVMWHPDLGEVPRWATADTVRQMSGSGERLLAPLAAYLTPDLIEIAGRLETLPADRLPWSGPDVLVVTHDAHAPGHLALLVDESGVLVSGDMLSDIELPMPADEDATLDPYLAGLEALGDVVGRASFLVPGHGTPTREPMARYDADMRYLDDLLARRHSQDPRIGDPANTDLHRANVRRAELTAGRR
jgi:glyoxylase-like metal-dependent hydrolase (beta-lactamase superfamily II)